MKDRDIFDCNKGDARPDTQSATKESVRHYDAGTIDDVLSLLKKYPGEAKILAGGVDLVTLMKRKVTLPRVLVNLKTVPGLAYIKEGAEGIKIGSLAKIHDIEVSEVIRDKVPILAEAAHSVAAPQVRNMATIGGNLCQEVWCWYYRRSPGTGRSFFCRRKGGTTCYAIAGDNRYHAILSGNKCFAVSPSDMSPALVALDARVNITGLNGNREIPLEELYQVMGTTLQPGEIITEIRMPSKPPNTKQRYLKFRIRKTIDFAIVSVAAVLSIEKGVVSDARIVLGGVAPTPYRALATEKELIGTPLAEATAVAASEAAVAEAVPLSMNRYKVHVTRSLVKRAILE